jgi:hypothetical protein
MALEFARSGSRLLAMGYSADGAKAFRTFHDQRLGFDCDFAAASSADELRCVPSAHVKVIYRDAECTRPAAWVQRYDGLETNDAVSSTATMALCPGDVAPHRESYRLGKQLSEETLDSSSGPAMFETSSAGCGPAGIPGKIAPASFELIPIDEAELARGVRASLKVSDSLRLSRLLAEDGAELSLGVTTLGGVPCEFQRDGSCVPEPIARPFLAGSGKFRRALNVDCSVPAFVTPFPTECGQPVVGLLDEGGGAPRFYSLEKPSAVFAWDVVLPITNEVTFGCMPLPSEVDDAAAPARELTGTFPKADTAHAGDGKLQVAWRMAGDNQLLPVLADPTLASPGVVPMPDFKDEGGQRCVVVPAEDGSERCVRPEAGGSVPANLTSYPEVTWGPL